MIKKLTLSALLVLGLFSQLSAQRLFWVEGNQGRIRQAPLNPTSLGTPTTFISGITSPRDLWLDPGNGRIFYTNNYGEDILEADLSDGSLLSTVITTGGMVYFEDFAYSENDDAIFAPMNPDVEGVYKIPPNNNDSGNETSLDLGGLGDDYYTAVAVDDGNELVYLNNRSSNYILVTNFAGTGGSMIGAPAGWEIDLITVDYATSKVYFTAWNTSTFNYGIFSANPDGSGVAQIVGLNNNTVHALAVYSKFNKIYYSQSGQIISRNLDGTGPVTLYTAPGGTDIDDIAIEGDYQPPYFLSTSVADNATDVPTRTTFTMTFSENVLISNATGTTNETSIRIYQTSGNVLVSTIDRSDIIVTGNTISFAANVTEPNTAHHVLIGNKVVADASNNQFNGINSATLWNYTTVPGVNITAPSATTCNGSFTTLPDIVITEAANSNFATGTGSVMTFNFQGTGYSFQPGVGSVTFTTGRNITAASITVTATSISVTYSVAGTNAKDVLTISGIKVSTNNAANAQTNIVRNGGTGIVDGLVATTVVGDVKSATPPATPVVSYPGGENFCQGSGMGVTVASVTGTDTRWYSDDALTTEIAALAGQNAATGTALSVNPAVPGSYLRYVTQTVGCESQPATVTITIDAPPTTANAGTNISVCNTTTTLAANTPTSGTGLWTILSGAGGTIATASSPTSTFTGVAGTTYVLQWTISNGVCASSSSTVSVEFIAPPTTAAAGEDQDVCGTSTVLDANTPAVGVGEWTIVSGSGGIIEESSNPTSGFTGVSGTTYVLRWTTTNGTCTPSGDEVIITFSAPPTTAVAGGGQTVCGSSVTLTGNTPLIGTGAWSIVSGAGGTIANPSSPTSTFTGVPGTAYSLRWTISNGSCTASTSDVSIALIASPTTAAAGGDQSVCGSSTTLAANTPAVGTGSWSVVSGSGGTFGNASSASSSFTGTPGTIYVLRWTTSNPGCASSEDEVQIVLITPPSTAAAGQDQNICGITTTLAGNTPTVGTGTWSIISGSGGTIATPSSPASSFSGQSGVTYTLRWTIEQPGCTPSTDDVSVVLNALPSGNGNVSGLTSLCPGVTGDYTVNGITSADDYEWNIPAGLELVTKTGNTAKIKANSGTGGVVIVTGLNNCGNGGTASATLTVLPIPDVSINVPSNVFIEEPVTFTYSSSATITSQQWSFENNGTSDEPEPTITYTNTGDFQVSIEVAASNECRNGDTKIVHVNGEPELTNASIKNVITANGDELNRYLHIDRIEKFPGSEVILIDRMGVEVFRKVDYLNDWDLSKNGNFLPAGSYVCVVKYAGKVYSRSVTVIKGH